MSDPKSNFELANETAEALLNAIKDAAPDANRGSDEALLHLAEAYALVRDAMPSRNPRPAPPGRIR